MEKYTSTDFKSDQEVRWCSGCGSYGVLAAIQRTMPKVAEETDCGREKFVMVSGIGCSSRLPYYMNVFGFHGIHGRATAISTGIKVANPQLNVWQACGDGDALAIGGNHFIHAIRRNIDINLILFNNRIYGLTKGQYSPTSKLGSITKTSPYGTVERPFEPGNLVLGAKGTFFARGLDTDLKLNTEILEIAAAHKGTSVVEMLVNCIIFNNGTHNEVTARDVRDDRTIVLRHGERMIFGRDRNKGLVLDGLGLRVVEIGKDGVTEDDILVHDAHTESAGIHLMLAEMKWPDFPVALGVIRDVVRKTFETSLREQQEQVTATSKYRCVDDLLRSGSTWEVE